MKRTASLVLVVMIAMPVMSSTSRDIFCPPWFIYNGNVTFHIASEQLKHCVCGHSLPYLIRCNQSSFTSVLLSGNCVFWSNTTGRTLVGHCPFIFPPHLLEGRLMQLPLESTDLNQFICKNLNRETSERGCGRCINGTGPSVTTLGSICAKCDRVNVLYYILLHYLPATIIFFFILIAQVDIISTPMLYYILYCSAWVIYLQTPDGFSTYVAFLGSDYKYTLRMVFILHSLVTFDPLYFISPPLCIKESLKDIHVPYYEMMKTLYPFLLLFLSYIGIELHAQDFKPAVILWKPFYWILTHLNVFWKPHISLVQAFTTIFFISYMKLLSLVTIPFIMTTLMDDNGEIVKNSQVTYIDPTVPVWDSQHIEVMVASLALLFLIILPPIALLTVYPTRIYKIIEKHLSPRISIAIKIFVSTVQGYHKDGTGGDKDFRALSGLIPAIFIIVIAIQYSFNCIAVFSYKEPLIIWHINSILFISTTVLLAVMRPHKVQLVNNIGLCLAALLGIGAILHIFVATYHTVNITVIFLAVSVVSIPHFVFYGYLMYRLNNKWKLIRKCRKCLLMMKSNRTEDQPILSHVCE